jgi:PBP1b-binding outer membrane lipoprotein LpoB
MACENSLPQGRKLALFRFMLSPKTGKQSTIMKKLICILASAALLGACEQKTETVAPAAPAEKKTENNTTIVNPPASTEKTKETKETTNSLTTAPAAEKKTETTTTTSTSPNP